MSEVKEPVIVMPKAGELLPCPFCGSEAGLEHDAEGTVANWYVYCRGAGGISDGRVTASAAMKQIFNGRDYPPTPYRPRSDEQRKAASDAGRKRIGKRPLRKLKRKDSAGMKWLKGYRS